MLPELSLDRDCYEDIIEEAKNCITSMYPAWTDFNEHDPGITMLELFAAMKEAQQFVADQIGEENRKKYLKLLGIRRRRKRPARSRVQIQPPEDCRLLCSHKLSAGTLCFETVGRKYLVRGDIQSCLTVCGEGAGDFIDSGRLELGNLLRFRIFGGSPAPGSCFYVSFAGPLPAGVPLELYLEVLEVGGCTRNPVGNFDFLGLVQLQWQYYTGAGWKDFEEICDGTYAFLFCGFVRFILEETMERTCVHGQTGYFIRAVLRAGRYDLAPVMTRISMNICDVLQCETLVEYGIQEGGGNSMEMETELAVFGQSEIYIGKDGIFYPSTAFTKEICEREGTVRFTVEDGRIGEADCILAVNRGWDSLHRETAGTGNGFPCQEFDLGDLQIEYESFEILVQDMEHREGFRFWQKVEDFAASSPEDMHYVFDSARGILRFGDCIHGMAPEGQILVAGCVRTMGSDGNVKAGAINRFRMEGFSAHSIDNICGGFGGRDEETMDEAFVRAGKLVREPECAVTARDYETYVAKTPGLLIESCKMISPEKMKPFMKQADETAVHLVVKPYGWTADSQVGRNYCRNIERYLERFRTVGSRVSLFFPEYVEIEVYLEALVRPQYLHVEEMLRQAVGQFFSSRGQEFGGVLSYSRLYGFIDRQEFLLGIRWLNMETRENTVRRNKDGDILLPPHGIAVLKDVKAFLTAGGEDTGKK